jgi:hypothetical protein
MHKLNFFPCDAHFWLGYWDESKDIMACMCKCTWVPSWALLWLQPPWNLPHMLPRCHDFIILLHCHDFIMDAAILPWLCPACHHIAVTLSHMPPQVGPFPRPITYAVTSHKRRKPNSLVFASTPVRISHSDKKKDLRNVLSVWCKQNKHKTVR